MFLGSGLSDENTIVAAEVNDARSGERRNEERRNRARAQERP